MLRKAIEEHCFEKRFVDLDAAIVVMSPSLRNRFMKKLTRERVVPTISARVS
jgi:hypothetical protein